MRASHINPFIRATQLVFETMLQTKVQIARPRVKTEDRASHDVTGIIALSGQAAGSVAVSFPLATAMRAVEAFTGTPVAQVDDNFTDAVGELANMIAGNAKKDLEEMHLSISVPTVIVGPAHRLGRHQLGPWIVLDCQSRLGSFTIEVCIVEQPALVEGAVR